MSGRTGRSVPDGKTVIEEKDILILGAVEAEGRLLFRFVRQRLGLNIRGAEKRWPKLRPIPAYSL